MGGNATLPFISIKSTVHTGIVGGGVCFEGLDKVWARGGGVAEAGGEQGVDSESQPLALLAGWHQANHFPFASGLPPGTWPAFTRRGEGTRRRAGYTGLCEDAKEVFLSSSLHHESLEFLQNEIINCKGKI